MAAAPTSLAAAAAIAELKTKSEAHAREIEHIRVELTRHVDDCAAHRRGEQADRDAINGRVAAVVDTLRKDMDHRFDGLTVKVESATAKLNDRISHLRAASTGQWERWQNYLIGALLALSVFLLMREFGLDSPRPQPTPPATSMPIAPPASSFGPPPTPSGRQ